MGGRGADHRRPRGWGGERDLLPEQAQVQLAQVGPGVDTELVGQSSGGRCVGGDRVGLPAAAVQGEQELADQPLVERVQQHQLLQLRQQLLVPAENRVGVDPVEQGRQAGCLQPGQNPLRGRNPLQLGQGGTPPEGERGPQVHRRGRDVARGQQGAP